MKSYKTIEKRAVATWTKNCIQTALGRYLLLDGMLMEAGLEPDVSALWQVLRQEAFAK